MNTVTETTEMDLQPLRDAASPPSNAEFSNAAVLADLNSDHINVIIKDESCLPEIVDASQLVENMPPPPPELVCGLLHQGSKLVLAGGSKCYKTWSLLDLGISVATGNPWWGFPVTKARVLYVNFEVQECFLAQRIQAICSAKVIALERGSLAIWNLRGYAADIDQLEKKIVERMKSEEFGLLIIDPIYKVSGSRDENSARDIGSLMNALERITVQTGCALAFGSHFSKGNQANKESMDRIGGSGVFARDPDAILTMTQHTEKDCFVVEPTLRNFAPAESFVLRRHHPLMMPDEALDPSKLKKAGGRPATHTAADLLDTLTKPMKTAAWGRHAEHEGITRATFYRLKKELHKNGQIEKSLETDEWSRSQN